MSVIARNEHSSLSAQEETERIFMTRSEERRVGKECVSTVRSRGAPGH